MLLCFSNDRICHSFGFSINTYLLKRKRNNNGPQLVGKGKRNPYAEELNKNNIFPPDSQQRPAETRYLPQELSPWSSVMASRASRSTLSSFGFNLQPVGPQPVKNESNFFVSPLNDQDRVGFPPNSQEMNQLQYFTPAQLRSPLRREPPVITERR